LTLESHQLST